MQLIKDYTHHLLVDWELDMGVLEKRRMQRNNFNMTLQASTTKQEIYRNSLTQLYPNSIQLHVLGAFTSVEQEKGVKMPN